MSNFKELNAAFAKDKPIKDSGERTEFATGAVRDMHEGKREMADYINRASLINHLNTFAPEHYNALVNDLILKEPAADVIERKKGKWISHLLDDGSFWANYCSECGVYLPYGLDWKPNGCPNCFADMRGET